MQIKTVNRAIEQQLIPAALERAGEAFRFVGPAVEHAADTTVHARKLNDLSVAEWIEQLEKFIAASARNAPAGWTRPTLTRPPEKRPGGAREGAGRKKIDEDDETIIFTMRMPKKQREKLDRLGGGPWIRRQIDAATDPRED